jgi:hypothetical protein
MPSDMSIDPREHKQGTYYMNHIAAEHANVYFMYVEAAGTRIVVAMAKKDIRAHEELRITYAPK